MAKEKAELYVESLNLDLPSENIYGHRKKLLFFLSAIKEYANDHPGQLKILDFGCGNGEAIGQYIAKLGHDYFGVDTHLESLAHAQKNVVGPNVKFAQSIPENEYFDIIMYGDVLEHLESPQETIINHVNKLSSHGIIIGAVPNGYGPFEIESAIDRKCRLTNKFQIVRSKYYEMRHFFAVHIKRWLLRRPIQSPSPLTKPIPFNAESGHIQFFQWSEIKEMLLHGGVVLQKSEKGVFMGAPFSGSLLGNCHYFLHLNTKLGDLLPYHMVSNWYFVAQKQGK